MLQGESSSNIKGLVEANGGKVTHDLRIINAVGAEITQSQLDLVSTSPLVHRVIDDLAVSGDQPEDSNRECNVGGSLELDFDNTVPEMAHLQQDGKYGDAGKTELKLACTPRSSDLHQHR